jgi:hypothetical protein
MAGKGILREQAMRQIDAAVEAAARRSHSVAGPAAVRLFCAAGDPVSARLGAP